MKNAIGKAERLSQDRIVQLFQSELGYRYLGNWQDELRTQPVEEDLLRNFLKKQGYAAMLIDRAVSKFLKSVTNIASGLYDANKEVYKLIRYGVNVREDLGEAKESVLLIDFENPENNDFAIAEEVSFKGKHNKRPDVVLYVNGIAIGVLELKSSRKGLEEKRA
ncbi:type I restriction endonuclease [Gillisia sp. Hel_I_29]|uniref:type I restriction endonuclease n=1 Tax=Gillisia sp. Hel_I_29 TaxID=1249975 RepID=UPI00054D1D46|nr:type I restriction endonuclease [Gillisia sp. Hel_I_29]